MRFRAGKQKLFTGKTAVLVLSLMPFLYSAELMESLRQAERKNWTLDQHHIANLCDSLNHFLTQTGQLPHLVGPQQPPRISDSCALNSGKQEQSMNQGNWEGN